MNRELVDVREVARLVGIVERTVWSWAKTGRLPGPALRNGRVVRWRRADLEAWLDAQAKGARP